MPQKHVNIFLHWSIIKKNIIKLIILCYYLL